MELTTVSLSEGDINIAEGEGQNETPGVSQELQEAQAPVKIPSVYVIHICGAVNKPGVYILDEGSRIYQVIEAAGGFREDAGEDYINQADFASDGMKIYVPTIQEAEEALLTEKGENAGRIGVFEGSSLDKEQKSQESGAASQLININTASEEALCTLSGVGSTKAKSIIAYREKNGAFQKIEDIMNVEGIKEGLFQKIRDSITV